MNDLVKALTDQFSQIDLDNPMDLSAVGLALSEIPAEMHGLSAQFESFREEVLSSLLFAGGNDELADRAEKLHRCLHSISVPERSDSIQELSLIVTKLSAIQGDADADLYEIAGAEQNTAEGSQQQALTPWSLQDAERMLDATVSAREYLSTAVEPSSERPTESEVKTADLDMALNSVADAGVALMSQSLLEQQEQLEIYRDTCKKLQKARTRMAESEACVAFIDSGLKGQKIVSDVTGTQYQWLADLVDKYRQVQATYEQISDEKASAIMTSISVLQSEADQLNAAVRKLGAETLEPPQSVLQSLNGVEAEPPIEASEDLDYENSITQYIEWITTQRESIRELKRQLALVEQKMFDTESEVDSDFAERLFAADKQREETKKRLSEAHRGASKDFEETHSVVKGLLSDSDQIVEGISRLMESRSAFIRRVEDSMTSTMIRLGEVLYEGNNRAALRDEGTT